jgi:orotate phosphoribosyltransferase
MMNKTELGKQIYDSCYLRGEFTLRSGTKSANYFDKYQFESNPVLLRGIARLMTPLIPEDTEILAGLEMGGVSLSTALSLETGLLQVQVRKEAKKYGTKKLAEGVSVKNKNVTIIEDIITTGGQIILSAEELRRLGANVANAMGVIERDSFGRVNLQKNEIKLITLFTAEEISS